MKIDYKKELESAAKTMILVHEPHTLIKLIVRMLVSKVKVSHAGILLHQRNTGSYILTVSRGNTGIKIPAGFARVDLDNPLIKVFTDKDYKGIFIEAGFAINDVLSNIKRTKDAAKRDFLKKILYQMGIFQVEACIPSFYRSELLAVLLLGRKNNNKRIAKEELNFFSALASDVAMAIRNAQLFGDLESELQKKYRLLIHTIIALAAAIDAKDHYTHGHTERVTNISVEIAKRLSYGNKKEYTEKFLDSLRFGALLHDIGKIGVPESILNKQGPLTPEEMEKMRQHTLLGSTILQPITELGDTILAVKYHHERFDGSGYPEGLKGNEIPIQAAIISVADAYDAMTSDRPYRKGLSREQALAELRKSSGTQFDPRVVNVLCELHAEGKMS